MGRQTGRRRSVHESFSHEMCRRIPGDPANGGPEIPSWGFSPIPGIHRTAFPRRASYRYNPKKEDYTKKQPLLWSSSRKHCLLYL